MAAASSRRPLAQRIFGTHPVGALFVAPYILFLVAVFAYPLGFAVYMSFYDYFFAAPGAVVDRPFVGLDNYTAVLGDPVFRTAVWNIVKFMIINVPLTVALSLVLATALNTKLPFRTFFRAAYYVPYVTASVAIVGIWLYLFNQNGLVNAVLGPFAPEPSWLVSEFWAMPMIALLVTWKQMGFYVLLYLAALQNVPAELHEAAAVDGAGTIQRFFYVTVPSVRPATVLVVILSTIIGAQIFTESYLLTGGGGPNNASVTPVLLMYREGIEQNHPGVAAAIGVLLAIAVLALSLFNRFVLERE
jgi:multiple sugar transport system permease protein